MRAKQPRQPPRRRFLQHERPGERALVQCIACDRDQARVVLGYARSFFDHLPPLQEGSTAPSPRNAPRGPIGARQTASYGATSTRRGRRMIGGEIVEEVRNRGTFRYRVPSLSAFRADTLKR